MSTYVIGFGWAVVMFFTKFGYCEYVIGSEVVNISSSRRRIDLKPRANESELISDKNEPNFGVSRESFESWFYSFLA